MNDYEYQKNSRFLQDWALKRQNTGKIYRQHFIIWGLIVSTLVYLLTIKFNFEEFEWFKFALRVIFWGLGSQMYAWLTIRTSEKLYRRLTAMEEHKEKLD